MGEAPRSRRACRALAWMSRPHRVYRLTAGFASLAVLILLPLAGVGVAGLVTESIPSAIGVPQFGADADPGMCEPCPPGEVGCPPGVPCHPRPPPCTASISGVTVAVASNGKSATITWTDNPSNMTDAFWYQLWGGGNKPATPSNHQVTISNLNTPQVYNYTIKGTNWCNYTAWVYGQIWTSPSGGGTCPEGTVTSTLSASTTTAGEAQLSWTDSAVSYTNPGPGDIFYWGLSTTYSYAPATPATHGVYLQELKPSTTYYYKIVAQNGNWIYSCYNSGTLTGSFTTKSSSTAPSSFTGTVYDSNGNASPAGMAIELYCNGISYGDTTTGGTGQANNAYTLPLPQQCSGSQSYTLQLGNPLPTLGGTLWTGHWNETIMTDIPGVIDFMLSNNSISPYIPQETDFMNAASGLTNASNITYTTGTIYTTTQTDCTVLFGIFGGCHSNSTVVSTGHGYTQTDGNFLLSQRYWTTGTVLFDGLNRTWWAPIFSHYATYGGPQFPGQQPVTDWLTPRYVRYARWLLRAHVGDTRGGSPRVPPLPSIRMGEPEHDH